MAPVTGWAIKDFEIAEDAVGVRSNATEFPGVDVEEMRRSAATGSATPRAIALRLTARIENLLCEAFGDMSPPAGSSLMARTIKDLPRHPAKEGG